jgi:hypothetical protein
LIDLSHFQYSVSWFFSVWGNDGRIQGDS